MYVCMYVYMRVRTHTLSWRNACNMCIDINIHTYMHTYIDTYIHAYIHTYYHHRGIIPPPSHGGGRGGGNTGHGTIYIYIYIQGQQMFLVLKGHSMCSSQSGTRHFLKHWYNKCNGIHEYIKICIIYNTHGLGH